MFLDSQRPTTGTLDEYLGSIARRLRSGVVARGLGALSVTALLVTALCVFLANRAAFSPASVIGSRTFLLAALGTVVALLLVIPLRRLARGRASLMAADEAEKRSPEFDGRLRTWADEREREGTRGRAPSPLLALLARETQDAAAAVPLDAVVSRPATVAFGATAIAVSLALLWLGIAGPGYWGYGTAKLWTGWLVPQDEPLYELQVEPGDAIIRQGGRLEVTATPVGFDPAGLVIYAKFESSVDWERAPMGPQLDSPGYQFAFSMVREPLRYYVEAGRLRSPEYSVGVVAMPTVENIRLEYEFPSWSGLEPVVEDPGGDIMAVKGTRVRILLTTDKELERGLLVVGGRDVRLRGNRAEIEIEEDSVYHVAALHQGERVRLTEDYFVTAVPDRKPEVKILEPGRDWRASSIEEVGVRVEASDDFGLRALELRYAVNGAEQPAVKLPLRRGAKGASGRHQFDLEELGGPPVASAKRAASESSLPPPAPLAGLMPGDLISYYVVASDAKRDVRSDMYFVNVQPFERRFSQSQQAPGQGGQGQRQDEVSRRQKEIIVATWNLIKERDSDDGREASKLRESATMLSQLQATLMQQAQTLADRTAARQLTATDPKFARFAEFLKEAVKYMEAAAVELADFDLDDAVGPEQQALQNLLRAENLFTDIQISMGRGGGGGGGASRDLAEMFELEMDLEKNQYETGGGTSGEQLDQEIDEAMKKLEELARRQERLADRTRDREQASFEQRWRQEMLRREAEDLKRDLERLQRRQQGQQSASSQRSQGSGSSQSQAGGSPSRQRLDRTIEQLERAARAMEQGSRGGNQRSASASAQRELQAALDEFAQQRQRRSQSAISEMAESAAGISRDQERAAAQLQESLRVAVEALNAQGGKQNGPLPTGMTREEETELADLKRDMGERLAQIEQGMQRQARALRDRNDAASQALMDALLELQQSDAAAAIQYAGELVRRGYAPYAASNEEAVSRALRRLRDNLREAEQRAAGEGNRPDESLAQVLSEVERLRRGLENAARGGEQGGSQSRSESSQEGSGVRAGDPSQPGSQRGPGSAPGELRGGWAASGSLGDGRWRGGLAPLAHDRRTRERMEDALEDGVAQVPRLTQRLRSSEGFDPRELAELRRLAQELGDGRFRGNPELLEREYRDMLAFLEQLEVRLRRQVELDDKEEVRAIVSEPVPESYREAVAEYYRRLGGSR